MQKIRPYNYPEIERFVRLCYKVLHQTFPNIKHPHAYALWKARFQDDIAVRCNIWIAEVDGLIMVFL